MVQKNKEYVVDIIDNGCEGEGITKINNFTIFIPGAIKNEKVKILIIKVNKTYAFGKIIEILKKSPYRVDSKCSKYKKCGGCNLRHIDYNETLTIKQSIIQNLVNKTLKEKIEVKEVIGMENPYNYRNKLQYPIGLNKKGESIMGIFAKRSHEIIQIDNCLIQNKRSSEIANEIYKFIYNNKISVYNENTLNGLFRHVVIKIGVATGQVMCILIINEDNIPKEKELVNILIKKFPDIKTIVKNINTKNTNVILGNKNVNIYGDGYIFDYLGGYTFKISAMSFYQTNPIQTKFLYDYAIKKAKLNNEDIVLDLYCGIGTISIFTSKYVKKVYGIETVFEAVKDGIENIKLNNIENCEFINGNVEDIIEDLVNKKHILPDVIFVDPPRKGLDNFTIETILKIKTKKIIYISCNPSTLARDLYKLKELYNIEEIQPVDMFPFTSHVECVAVLQLK